MKKYLIMLLFSGPLLFFPAQSSAETKYIDTIDYDLEQPFAGEDKITSSSQYINAVYRFALGIVGIIAVVLIMFGGLRWMAAAGNESIITEAKEIVSSAVIGLAIALLSYVILAFINPQILIFGFAPAKIEINSDGADFWKIDWCNEGSYKDQKCEVDGAAVACNDVACSQKGYMDGAFCRGAKCETATGEGTKGCYRDPKNTTGAAACQVLECGKYVTSCYDAYKDDEVSRNRCICAGYNKLVANALHFPASYSDWSQQQTDLLQSFCNEGTKQVDWVSTISAKPSYYGYTGSTDNIKDTCWNLGSSLCKYDVSTGYEVSFIPFYTPAVTVYACIAK